MTRFGHPIRCSREVSDVGEHAASLEQRETQQPIHSNVDHTERPRNIAGIM